MNVTSVPEGLFGPLAFRFRMVESDLVFLMVPPQVTRKSIAFP